jgi:transposase-like protein
VERCGMMNLRKRENINEQKGSIMRQRKAYNANLKAKIGIEAIKEEKTINELAGLYGVHPNQISQWKKKILESAPSVFTSKENNELNKMKKEQENLYRRVGELTMEVEYLKKKFLNYR